MLIDSHREFIRQVAVDAIVRQFNNYFSFVRPSRIVDQFGRPFTTDSKIGINISMRVPARLSRGSDTQ